MEEKTIIEFDYNIEQLDIIKNDLSAINKEDMEQVSSAIKQLVKIRRAIQTRGKSYRDEHTAFNKKVSEKENEYVGIIEPLEEEYKRLVKEDEEKREIMKRRESLPTKQKQLNLLKVVQPTEDEILSFDDAGWVTFYESKMQEHERNVFEEENKVKLEKERAAREVEIKKLAEEQARKKLDDEQKKRDNDALLAKAKLEADKAHQDFLAQNNYNKSTDIIKEEGGEIKLYRLVNSYQK